MQVDISEADRSGDIAIVARVIADATAGTSPSDLPPSVVMVSRDPNHSSASVPEFVKFVSRCRLSEIGTHYARFQPLNMPVSALWSCKHPDVDNTAAFWFEDGKIVRVAYGPQVTVVIPPPPERQ